MVGVMKYYFWSSQMLTEKLIFALINPFNTGSQYYIYRGVGDGEGDEILLLVFTNVYRNVSRGGQFL
jgi:hypothetical protein